VVVAILVASGCNEPEPPDTSTPEATFRALVRAHQRGDADAAWALMTPEARDALAASTRASLVALSDEELDALGLDRDDLDDPRRLVAKLAAHPDATLEHRGEVQIVAVDQDGDQATVTVSAEGRSCELEMARTRYGWRITHPGRCGEVQTTVTQTIDILPSPATAVRVVPAAPPAQLPPHWGLAPAHDQAAITIRTNPPGATVRVDGVVVGVSPLRLDRPPGPVTIQIELAGYRTEVLPLVTLPQYTYPIVLDLVR
jgi:hypothetical protein